MSDRYVDELLAQREAFAQECKTLTRQLAESIWRCGEYENALKKIANLDYRGHRETGSILAEQALQAKMPWEPT
jgi:DNA-binding SARP family transcriptional activator